MDHLYRSRMRNLARLSLHGWRQSTVLEGTGPAYMNIEATNHCNARCPLCPTGNGELRRAKEFMSLAAFKQIIDQSQQHLVVINLFNYGESFLNPAIFEMISYAAARQIKVWISTNGYVFYNPENIDRLLHSGLHKLIVSIDGWTQATNEQYRRNVKLAPVLEGVQALQERKRALGLRYPKVIVQSIEFQHNRHEIAQIRDFAHRTGCIFRLKAADVGMVQDQTIDKRQFIPLESRSPLQRYAIADEQITQVGSYRNYCPNLWNSMVINADGSGSVCCHDSDGRISLGAVPEASVSTMWNSQPMRTIRQQVLRDQSQLALCRDCPIALDNHKLRHHSSRWGRFKLSNLALPIANGGLRWLVEETWEQLWFGLRRQLQRLQRAPQPLTVSEQVRWAAQQRAQERAAAPDAPAAQRSAIAPAHTPQRPTVD